MGYVVKLNGKTVIFNILHVINLDIVSTTHLNQPKLIVGERY
jgi:hypothetical protein